MIILAGTLRTRSYLKDDQKRTATYIRVDEVHFGGVKKQSSGPASKGPTAEEHTLENPIADEPALEAFSDDYPFQVMAMINFVLGLFIGGIVGMLVMCVLQSNHNAPLKTYDDFIPNPTDFGRNCRGNGEYDLECQCEGCEVALDCMFGKDNKVDLDSIVDKIG